MSRSFLRIFLFLAFCSVWNITQAQPASELYDQADKLFHEGRYKEAEKLFLKALEQFEHQFGQEHKETLKPIKGLGKTYIQLREHEKALRYLQSTKTITTKLYGPESVELAYCLIDIGHVYAQMYMPDNANDAYNQALAFIEKTHGKESSKTANVLMNIGSAYHKKGEYLDAERYYQSAFDIFSRVSEPDSEDFNRIYSNMGYMYRKKGDLTKALDYGLKALDIKLKNYDSGHPSVGKYYRNIGRVYEEMNRMKEALPYMQKAVKITEMALGAAHPQTAGSYAELAHIYAGIQQYDTALVLYQKGNRLLENKLPGDHPYVVAGYVNIAKIYYETGLWGNALENYRLALSRLLARSFRPGILIAQIRNDMSSVFLQQESLDSALIYCQLAMEEISPGFSFRRNDLYENPSIEGIQAEVQLLKILAVKARVLEERYNKNNVQEINLSESLKTILLAVDLIEQMRLGYQSKSSRQYLNTGTASIYKTGVRVAMQLYKRTQNEKYLWQAFELSENSKASILWRSLNEGMALVAAGIPMQEQKTITILEQQIASLEEELAQVDSEITNDLSVTLRGKLFDLKLKHSKQITYLERKYPGFYQLRYAAPVANKQKLMEKLTGSGMALINYIYDDDHLFIFLLDKNGLKGFVQPFEIDLLSTIKYVREFEVTTILSTGKEGMHVTYLQHLKDLHAHLIEPVLDDLQNIKKLVIVPHGIIHYLPFEMLIDEINGSDFRNQPYLLYDFTIQYAWSSALWVKEIPFSSIFRQKFTGFAPSFELTGPGSEKDNTYRASLFNLTFSTQEIADAKSLFGGRNFIGDGATVEAFKKFAPTSRILHLATHAIVNNEQSLLSAIAFTEQAGAKSDQFLYAHEIYNLKLSAEMAVMSACNTGTGELAEGEGVMSLGRAFFHAGCRSVIMSQWPANDRTTYRLMSNFYQYIAQGQHKDEALQNAKIAHLANADALTAHPYFWAGMIAVGDMRPLPNDQQNHNWLLVLLLVLFVAGIGILYLKQKA